jgi:phenylacetic acid degradation operon negative regulatory protein
VHARSALFDLYGDHLRARGARAPVAALVRLLAPLGVHPPAVRTAVSRMVRQGWLEPVRIDGLPGYALTARARRRLDDAAARIYRTEAGSQGSGEWDRTWHLSILREVPNARRREQLASQFAFLGWAPLSDAAWVGLRNDTEVDQILGVEGIAADRFRARPTSRRSRSGPNWCTNGASSCSSIRGCRPSCCPPIGPVPGRPSSSISTRIGWATRPGVSWTTA